mmetsp:Transcript_36331/g.90428  ORF Transcript_36331/g.90428 Transcript_36331/m.90428 type:complete len:412 (-) Transcript_36331:901-2136(-)
MSPWRESRAKTRITPTPRPQDRVGGTRSFYKADALPSGCEAIGIAWEHGRLSDVVQLEEEHHDALESNAAACVRVGAVLERIDVILNRFQVHSKPRAICQQHVGIVNALCARRDLLPANEDIVRVGPLGVVRVRHRVERAERRRELVDGVKVGPFHLAHHRAQQLLVARGEVLVVRVRRHGRQVLLHVDDQLLHLARQLVLPRRLRRLQLRLQLRQLPRAHRGAVRAQQGARLVEAHAEGRAGEAQVFERVLRADGFNLCLAALVQALEDVEEHSLDDVEHLVVVVVEGHLQVEAGELRHVAVRERLLRSEDRPDLKHAAEVRHERHLLVELRRLREEGVAVEIFEPEDVGAAFRCRCDHLGRVDLDEALRQEALSEERADGRLDAEDPLVGGGAQVDHAVVEADALVNAR